MCVTNSVNLSSHISVIDKGNVSEPTEKTGLDRSTTGRGSKKMSTQFQIQDMASKLPCELPGEQGNPQLLNEQLEILAGVNPHKVALEIGAEKLSYGELNADANRVANYLVGKGVQSGDCVALHLEKSADLFTCLLGVVKAGAAFAVIDVKSSAIEQSEAIEAVDASLIFSTSELSVSLNARFADKVVRVDEHKARFATLTAQTPFLGVKRLKAADVAYVTFVPGSGQDVKQVMHRDAVKFLRSLVAVYGVGAHDNFYQDASLAVDVAIQEVLAIWFAGGTAIVGSEGSQVSPAEMAVFLKERQISVLSTVPAALALIDDALPTIEIVIVGGDVCSSDLAVTWALRCLRVVTLKSVDDRFPIFAIGQENCMASRPRLLACC